MRSCRHGVLRLAARGALGAGSGALMGCWDVGRAGWVTAKLCRRSEDLAASKRRCVGPWAPALLLGAQLCAGMC